MFYYLSIIIIGIVVLFVLAIPFAIWERKAKSEKLDDAFAGREPLDEQTFYEKYFRARGVPSDVVIKVKRIFESELGVDLSRLSAEDDFSRNLSFLWEYDSMADVEIVIRLEEEFGIKIADAEAEKANTIEAIVNLVWSKLHV